MGAAGDDGERDILVAESAADNDLAQRLALARASTVDAMERLLRTAQDGEVSQQAPSGTGYLLFRCAGVECAVPLSVLREVLPAVPQAIYLPFSPEWMLGIFPLRNEMVGLVDPLPVLSRRGMSYERPDPRDFAHQSDDGISSTLARDAAGILPGHVSTTAIVVGSGERCLAWVVEAVGDIALVQDGELHSLAEHTPHDLPIAPRYILGYYASRETRAHAVILDAEALLTDLLEALADGNGGRYA